MLSKIPFFLCGGTFLLFMCFGLQVAGVVEIKILNAHPMMTLKKQSMNTKLKRLFTVDRKEGWVPFYTAQTSMNMMSKKMIPYSEILLKVEI